jgi:hypothetical protein
VTLKQWIKKVDHGWDYTSSYVRELPQPVTYSEDDRFCQVFNLYGPPARQELTELEDYTLMNVQYWSDLIQTTDYRIPVMPRPALFSFQRKQKPDRNKATPWKLRSR